MTGNQTQAGRYQAAIDYQVALRGLRAAEARNLASAHIALMDGELAAATRAKNTADNLHEAILQLTTDDFKES